jgi:transposase-like protein
MGHILHGSATTTEAIRRAIQNSEESLRALSARYGINQKTVAKWRKRTSVADLPTGPKDVKSTVLTPDEERSSSRSGGIRCLRWTIVSIHCSLRYHI